MASCSSKEEKKTVNRRGFLKNITYGVTAAGTQRENIHFNRYK